MVTSKRERQLQAERRAKRERDGAPKPDQASNKRKRWVSVVALILAILMIGSTLGAIFAGSAGTP